MDSEVKKIKTSKRWSIDEINFLIENYSERGGRYCANSLKNRSIECVNVKARFLGLRINTDIKKIRDAKLEKEYQDSRLNSDFNVNVEKFLDIKTKEVAYFLGFLWADGHVKEAFESNRKLRDISLKISTDDFLDIKKVLNSIGDWRIYDVKTKEGWKNATDIRTRNIRLNNFLVENDYHIKSYSSANKIISKIPNELKHYFFRGLSDGDGCFYYSDKKYRMFKQFSITSNYNQDWTYMECIFNQIGLIYNVDKTITNKGHKYSRIRLIGNNAKLFGDYIYKGMHEDFIGLKRKYNKYLLIKESVENGIIQKSRNPELLDKQKEMAINLNKEGITRNEIIKKTGIAGTTLSRLIKNNGLEMNTVISNFIKNKKNVLDLDIKGIDKKQIAIELNLSLRTVNRYLKIKKTLTKN